jgi:hypothetical protein
MRQTAGQADAAGAETARGQGSELLFERFRIGAFDVAVRSELAEAQRDFAHLYRHCALGAVGAAELDRLGHIVVEAVRRGAGLWRRRYVVLGDREEIFVGRRTAEVLPYLEWAVNWRIMARRGEYCQVHAASLSRQGAGVVFAAGSGSGKSTLAAGALARGWSYLSDEFALIDARSRQLTPFPKAMCIKAGSFAAVRQLGLPLFARRHYAKATKGRVGFLSPADLPAGAAWVFDEAPFFLLLNLAVGGLWPGYPDATTRLPQEYRVDYVRVYRRE